MSINGFDNVQHTAKPATAALEDGVLKQTQVAGIDPPNKDGVKGVVPDITVTGTSAPSGEQSGFLTGIENFGKGLLGGTALANINGVRELGDYLSNQTYKPISIDPGNSTMYNLGRFAGNFAEIVALGNLTRTRTVAGALIGGIFSPSDDKAKTSPADWNHFWASRGLNSGIDAATGMFYSLGTRAAGQTLAMGMDTAASIDETADIGTMIDKVPIRSMLSRTDMPLPIRLAGIGFLAAPKAGGLLAGTFVNAEMSQLKDPG